MRNYKLVQVGAREIGMVSVMTKVTTLGLITFVAIGGQVTIIDIDDEEENWNTNDSLGVCQSLFLPLQRTGICASTNKPANASGRPSSAFLQKTP